MALNQKALRLLNGPSELTGRVRVGWVGAPLAAFVTSLQLALLPAEEVAAA
jgi:hypothetical protein